MNSISKNFLSVSFVLTKNVKVSFFSSVGVTLTKNDLPSEMYIIG